MPLKHFEVIGRRQPTATDPSPQIYRMRLFVKAATQATSRFWYFMHKIDKMKRSTGEVLGVHEIRERKADVIKNYAITIKYNSRSGTHNMYKEYRDVTLCGAVEQMYSELSGRHRARFSSIQIVDARCIPSGIRAARKYDPEEDGPIAPVSVRRPHMKQVIQDKLAFPLAHRISRPSNKSLTTTYKASRPTTFFG